MTDYAFEADREKVVFGDIMPGEMFVDEMEHPCVKTLDATTRKGDEFNAVRVTDGEFCYFQDNWSVVRIKKGVFTV